MAERVNYAAPKAPGKLRPSQRQAFVLIVGLLIVATAVQQFRRSTIRGFFLDAPPGTAPTLSQPPGPSVGLSSVPYVRVLLIDGLDLQTAQRLPALNAACAQGADLVADTGFPTVSLPVQHVLWTGLTQVQSGIMYRIAALPQSPTHALPARVPGSWALADAHSEIVGSFGFATLTAPVPAKSTTPEHVLWRQHGFAASAREAAATATPLVFVHALAVDEAGHASGGRSEAYQTAAQQADGLLASLLAARPADEGTRWFVLSDHGHRAQGGHADAEPHIRHVRLCVLGGGVPAMQVFAPMHLVDVHRALADSLAVAPAAASLGRPWDFALAHPDLDRTLPKPKGLRWLVAGLIWLTGLIATFWLARGTLAMWPWWGLLAAACLLAIRGPVTLSNPIVYPPLGLSTFWAMLPGLLMLCAQSVWALRAYPPHRVVAAALVAPLCCLAGSAVLSGAAQTQLRLSDAPPLMPTWSAVVSVAATACAAASLAVALALLGFWLAGLPWFCGKRRSSLRPSS